MSDLLPLYDALAGSASIFIGILAALLVNRIISDENDRSQIRQRVDYINSNVEGLKQRRNEIDDRLEAIFADEHQQNQRKTANKYLDEFISKISEGEFDIDDSERIYPIIADKFESFVDRDDWSNWAFHIALIERFDEVMTALGKDEMAYEKQMGWEFRKLRQTLEQHQRGLILDQRVADRRSLNQELNEMKNLYNRLETRYAALNISKHRTLLGILAVSLGASGLAATYGLHAAGVFSAEATKFAVSTGATITTVATGAAISSLGVGAPIAGAAAVGAGIGVA